LILGYLRETFLQKELDLTLMDKRTRKFFYNKELSFLALQAMAKLVNAGLN